MRNLVNRRYRRLVYILAVVTLGLVSCAGNKSAWTPETVAPPVAKTAELAPTSPLAERAQELVVESGKEQAIPLTLDAALLTALSHNRGVDLARLGPQIGETYVPEARAAFDPVIRGDVTLDHQARPVLGTSTSSTTYSGAGVSGATNTKAADIGAVTSAVQSTLNSTVTTLNSLQSLMQTIDNAKSKSSKSNSTQGSLSLVEKLPTGTEISVETGLSGTRNNLSTDSYQGNWSVNIAQPLLQGAGLGTNLAALRQARNQKEKSKYVFRQSVMDTLRSTEVQYWQLTLAQELRKIREFALGLAREQLKYNQDLLDVGRALEADVLASDAEVAAREAALVDAEASIKTQTIELLRLLSPGDGQQWGIRLEPQDVPAVVEVPIKIEESAQTALSFRPELAQTRLDLASYDQDVIVAKNGLLPKLDAVGSFGLGSEGTRSSGMARYLADDDYESYSVGLQFETPILYRAEKARLRRAKLTREQAERSLSNLEQAVQAEVRQAHIAVRSRWDSLQATQRAVESRTEQLRVEKGRYHAGKAKNLDILVIERDLIQARVDDATARIGYIEALTSFFASEGTLLERRGITLEEEKN